MNLPAQCKANRKKAKGFVSQTSLCLSYQQKALPTLTVGLPPSIKVIKNSLTAVPKGFTVTG